MIGSIVQMNDSIYLKVPVIMKQMNLNKFEMLQYNNIKGVLDFKCQYFNEKCFLSFNLKTCVSLKSLLEKNSTQEDLIVEILSQINDIVLSLDEYFLLESKDLILSIENIYYDFQKKEVFLVYIPQEQNKSLETKYKLLIKKLIIHQPDERKYSLLTNQLNIFINKDEFSVGMLEKLIKNQLVNDMKGVSKKAKVVQENIFDNRVSLSEGIKTTKTVEKKASKNEKLKNVLRGVALEVIGILTINIILQNFAISNRIYQIILLLVVQLIFVWIIYLVAMKDYINIEKIRNYLDINGDYAPKTLDKANIFDTKTPIVSESIPYKKRKFADGNTVIESSVEEKYISKAYLLKKDFISEEKIYITEKSFVLGREVGITNYHIDDKKISKRHLEVLDINDEIFIRDLNSTNGTYLNQKHLDANRLTKIFDGDLIKMASLVYEFKID